MTREAYSILKRLKNEAGRDIYNNNLREICIHSYRTFKMNIRSADGDHFYPFDVFFKSFWMLEESYPKAD